MSIGTRIECNGRLSSHDPRIIVRHIRDNGTARNRLFYCRAGANHSGDIFGITTQQGLCNHCPKNARCRKQLIKMPAR